MEIKEQLEKIASSLEEIAESIEKQAEESKETKPRDFGFGKVGSTPDSGADPLTKFLLS